MQLLQVGMMHQPDHQRISKGILGSSSALKTSQDTSKASAALLIHRCVVAMPALAFFADWPEFAYFDRFEFSSGETSSECVVHAVLSIQFEK